METNYRAQYKKMKELDLRVDTLLSQDADFFQIKSIWYLYYRIFEKYKPISFDRSFLTPCVKDNKRKLTGCKKQFTLVKKLVDIIPDVLDFTSIDARYICELSSLPASFEKTGWKIQIDIPIGLDSDGDFIDLQAEGLMMNLEKLLQDENGLANEKTIPAFISALAESINWYVGDADYAVASYLFEQNEDLFVTECLKNDTEVSYKVFNEISSQTCCDIFSEITKLSMQQDFRTLPEDIQNGLIKKVKHYFPFDDVENESYRDLILSTEECTSNGNHQYDILLYDMVSYEWSIPNYAVLHSKAVAFLCNLKKNEVPKEYQKEFSFWTKQFNEKGRRLFPHVCTIDTASVNKNDYFVCCFMGTDDILEDNQINGGRLEIPSFSETFLLNMADELYELIKL